MKSRTLIYYVLLILTALLISFNAAIGIFILEAVITFTISNIKELVDKLKAKEISASPFSMFLFVFWFQIANYFMKYVSMGLSWMTDSVDKGIQYVLSLPPPKVIVHMDPMPTILEYVLEVMNDINTSTTFKDLEGNVLILIFLLVVHLAITITLTCGCLMFISHIKQQINEEEQTAKEKTDTNDSKKEIITEVV